MATKKGGAHAAEGAVICVMENNIMTDNGYKKEMAKPSFGLVGDITTRKFDDRHYVTEIATSKAFGAKEDQSGNVIRIGAQWSVIKANGPNSLIVWGKITDEAPEFAILDDYSARK